MAAINIAIAWVDMCRPSATSASEPKAIPPPISSTIIAEHSQMTAHARRSFLTWPAPRKMCECSSAVTLAVSLEVALHDVDEFVGGLGARLTGTRSARHEVLADVILDDFRQQAAHGAAARGQQLHDPAAIRILVQCPLDRLDLPTQAAEPIDELGSVANGVCHARLIPYRGMISKSTGGGDGSEPAARGGGAGAAEYAR